MSYVFRFHKGSETIEGWQETTQLGNKDIEAIEKCDVVVAIDWGLYGDCGTAWEIGYAWAKDKHLLVVVPDEVLASKHSLMVANGCDNFISVSRFLANKDLNFVLDGNEQRYFLYGVEQQ